MNDQHIDNLSPNHDRMNIRLRPEQSGDEGLLFQLYASTREEELAMTGWDAATRDAFLNMQFRAMRQGYASMFPRGEFSIIIRNGEPAGRVVVDRTAGEIHVVDIVISVANRNQGIGATIMSGLIAEARQAGKRVTLYVLKNSRAIRFYKRLGFFKIGETEINDQMEWRAGKVE
jgi:ribosomal protein S18 acetylase RimI-like enzyme